MKTTIDAVRFGEIITFLSNITDEIKVVADQNGITTTGMDPSHICMFFVTFSKDDMTTYEVNNEESFGLRLDLLKKIMSRVSDTIGLEYTNGELQIIDPSSKTYKMRTIEATTSETKIPNIKFTTKIALDATRFFNILDDVAVVSDVIEFISTKETMKFSSKGDSSSVDIIVTDPIEFKNDSEALVKANFSLEYLKTLKSLKSVDTISLSYANNIPLKITTRNVEYYLAPRMTD